MSAYLHISDKKRVMLAEDDRSDMLHALVLGLLAMLALAVAGLQATPRGHPGGCFCNRLRDKKSASYA